ncbi:MAG: hypothetical protein ACRDJG_00210 [Actinomycetota bacterium]
MSDSPGYPREDAREELPVIGGESGQSFADCCSSGEESCSASLELGFEGFTVTSEGTEEDAEARRRAWKATLAREGKLHREGKSLRDLIMKPPS